MELVQYLRKVRSEMQMSSDVKICLNGEVND